MNFTITFLTQDQKLTINQPGQEIGIKGVKQVRSDLNLPKLSLDIIYPETNHFYLYCLEVTINEETAQNSNLFQNKNNVQINVTKNDLKKFMVLKTITERSPNNDIIESASLQYQIDKEKLINTWVDANYPTNFLP